MFNRTQKYAVGFLYVFGVMAYAVLNPSEENPVATGIGFMIPGLLMGLAGCALGRKINEKAAIPGIFVGYLIPFLLLLPPQ